MQMIHKLFRYPLPAIAKEYITKPSVLSYPSAAQIVCLECHTSPQSEKALRLFGKFGRNLLVPSHAGTRLPIAVIQDTGRSPCVRTDYRDCFSALFQRGVIKIKKEIPERHLRKKYPATSYGGMIRIRSRVEVGGLPLSLPHRLPCLLPGLYSIFHKNTSVKNKERPNAPNFHAAAIHTEIHVQKMHTYPTAYSLF